MTSIRPRHAALALAATLLVAPLLAPAAAAYKSTSSHHVHDRKGGDQYVASSGAVAPASWNPGTAYFSGNGWIEFAFSVTGPGGVAPDLAAIDSVAGGPGSCRWQVTSSTRGALTDTGWRGCDNNWETLWREQLPAYTGTLTLRVSYQGTGGGWVSEANSYASWGMLEVSVTANAPYSSADVSEGRVSGTPGTCLDVPVTTTPSHVSVLDVDWGDGTTTTLPAPAGVNSYSTRMTLCHAYAPSTVPYQMCARVRETNGLQRATPSDCRDLPFMLPTV